MSLKKDIAEFIHYAVNDKWRFSVRDEPDDIVLRVDFFKSGEWGHIARIEQSSHSEFHAHLPGMNEPLPLASNLSREDKLKLGFEKIREYFYRGLIHSDRNYFVYDQFMESVLRQMLNKEVKMGERRNAKSITGTARITDSLDIVVKGADGKIKFTSKINDNNEEINRSF